MASRDALLSYESRDGGAILPGETVLWDGLPMPMQRQPLTVSTVISLLVVAGLVVAGWYFDQYVPTSLAAILTFAFAVLALVAMNDWFGIVDRTSVTSSFRVTDRRIIRAQQRATPPVNWVSLEDLEAIIVRRDRRGRVNVRFDGTRDQTVEFEAVSDVRGLLHLALTLPAQTNRRGKVRRGTATPRAVSDTVAGVNDAALPDDVPLLEGEALLWSGRPRKWDRIDAAWVLRKALTLALLAVPIAILLAATGRLGPRAHISHWLSTAVSILWLWIGLHSLTLTPLLDARRRARMGFYLTNLRAITQLNGRTRETRSTFLDMAGAVDLIEEPDGTGEVRLRTGGGFERIAHAAEVYAMILDAIRAGGGPASQLADSSQPQHVGGGDRDES